MGRPVRIRFILPFILVLAALNVSAEVSTCASRPDELNLSSELMRLRDYFPDDGAGYVNETAGSYFEVSVNASVDISANTASEAATGYVLTFYTSGFLDLYGVMRSGPAKFCVDGGILAVHSMGQVQKIQLQAGRLLLDEGGPRKSFARGSMPLKLAKLHRPPGTGGSRSSEKGFASPAQREEY